MIDLIMAVFPAVSSLMLMLNVKSVWRDKKVYGVSLTTLGFFTTYAAWMVFYFYHKDAEWPMWTAFANLLANAAYLGSAYYFKRSQNDRLIPTSDTQT